MVIVVVLTPSAATVVGNAMMPAAAADGTANFTAAVSASVTLSVVSFAVTVNCSGVASVIVNTAEPFSGDVAALGGEITLLPPLGVRLTFLPPTRLPPASRSVTTMLALVVPSAGIPENPGEETSCGV